MPEKRTIDAVAIAASLAGGVAAIGASFARDGDAARGRAALRQMLNERMPDLSKMGLQREDLEPAADLVWGDIRDAVQDHWLPGAFLVYRLERRGAAQQQDLVEEDLARFSELGAGAWMEYRARIPEAFWQGLLDGDLPKRIAATFVAIESLPWNYEVWMRTPLPVEWQEIAGSLGPSHALGSPELEQDPVTGARLEIENLYHRDSETISQARVEVDWDKTALYVHGWHTGYLRKEPIGTEAPVLDITNLAKQLLGLCLAAGVLEITGTPNWDHAEPIMLFDYESHFALRWWPVEEAAVLGALAPRRFETENQRSFAKRQLRWISAAFARRDERLLRAGRWFFESFCGSNALLQLVQATTTLEILLGDDKDENRRKKGAGVTDLLAVKYAYLTAHSHAQRTAAAEEFSRVYGYRSKVVHAGSDAIDTSAVVKVRSMCMTVIQHELVLHEEI